jgi:hypothetical protein
VARRQLGCRHELALGLLRRQHSPACAPDLQAAAVAAAAMWRLLLLAALMW